MRGLAYYCLLSAAVYALIGMAGGIAMGATQDHTLAPAHAHLNLLGFVAFSIYGFYYHLVPTAADSRLAKLHIAVATLGLWSLIPGIVMANLGMNDGLAVLGALATILSMALFATTVGLNRATA